MARRRGRGEGSIWRRSDGRWEGRVDLGWAGGKRRRRAVYGGTRREAATKLAVLLRAHQEGMIPLSPAQKLSDYLDVWLRSIEGSVRPKTLQTIRMYVRLHIIPDLGKSRLDKLQPQRVQALLDAKLKAGLAPQTVIHIRAILRRALGRAVRYGWIHRNVAALTDPPRLERFEIKPFLPDEARAFLDAARGDDLEALYKLALSTGLRQGELLGLKWEDLSLDSAELRVNHALQRYGGALHLVPPKTARSRRSVPIPALAIEALRVHRAKQRDARLLAGARWHETGLVFTTKSGTPIEPTNATRSFKRLLARAGIRQIRFHDLRHSCATLLLVQGVSPRVVMEILGHSQISLTMNTYSHVIPALQREAAARLDALLTREA
jgi:integrase